MKTTAILDSPTLFRKAFSSFMLKLLIKSKNYELDTFYQLENVIQKTVIDYLFFDPTNFNEDLLNQILDLKKEKKIIKLIILTSNETYLRNHLTLKSNILNVVDSIISKDCSESQIIELFHYIDKNEYFFPTKSIHKQVDFNLTKQERCILKMLIEGKSNEQISNKLCISIHTFRTHRKNIMKKVGVNTSTDLILYSLKNNIINN
ncbi:LuxR C-terminal-related transcriptional regulator [Flavobacterium columnare]|uniref:LuxR C-terminal-related transcriptional regulator n=1 Tax=Flavobacterium columnare TaxID=996 RepID=UPI000F4FA19D|nr:LuxR family transcriptional regulator [Flavobacterium columnare]